MATPELPDEARFRARLERSGHLDAGRLDLAIDSGGVPVGRIQTYVPPGRPLPPGTFEVGISLQENARGKGYGREALALLTDWLFEQASAEAVEAATDPVNAAMRSVFERVGWMPAGAWPTSAASGSCTELPDGNGRLVPGRSGSRQASPT